MVEHHVCPEIGNNIVCCHENIHNLSLLPIKPGKDLLSVYLCHILFLQELNRLKATHEMCQVMWHVSRPINRPGHTLFVCISEW